MEKDHSNIIINIGAGGSKPFGCGTLLLEAILFILFVGCVVLASELFR